MKKKLYRTAFISSPIIALIAITPAYAMGGFDINYIFLSWTVLTSIIFVFWNINIFLLLKIEFSEKWKRYVSSYCIIIAMQIFNVSIIKYLRLDPPNENILFPILGSIAMNTLIQILLNSIVLQFQKESAELEIQHLKISNLEAQKQILLQQLQPHFLFNALSTLKSLINDSPKLATDYIVRLSDFLRYSVQAKNHEIVTLEDEIKFTKDYIDLQKVRFGDALNFEIHIPENFFEQYVPVYALQALVENAIKHNAFTDKKPLFISIIIKDNSIEVSNNKLPKALHLPSGTGLENLNLRYKMIANNSIEIKETDTNFSVIISLVKK